MSRSVDACCFDDSSRFVRKALLEIEELDAGGREAWMHDGRKLERLHEYWFYLVLDAMAASSMAAATIGSPKKSFNHLVAAVLDQGSAVRGAKRVVLLSSDDERAAAEIG